MYAEKQNDKFKKIIYRGHEIIDDKSNFAYKNQIDHTKDGAFVDGIGRHAVNTYEENKHFGSSDDRQCDEHCIEMFRQ